jgi:Starch-binding associating with outer membrane
MKNIKIGLLAIVFFGAFGCGKNFDDLNVNPNNPSNVPSEALLTSAETFMAKYDFGADAFSGLILSQYWAQNNYSDESRWQFRPGSVDFYFGAAYQFALKDLEEIVALETASDAAASAVSKNKVAIARILQSYIYHTTTDVWGPLPYSEALLGDRNRSPKYDAQKDIYMSLLARLHESIAAIDENEGSFGNADIIYAGDVASWKKFAHSLIMRVAMRMADVEPAIAKSEVEGAFADAFSSAGDVAKFVYLSGNPNNNPLNQLRIERGDADFGLSNILIDRTLLPLNDPRLDIWADEKLNGGGFTGRPFGQNSDNAAGESPDEYSQPSGAQAVQGNVNFGQFDLLAAEMPNILMQYSEVCFILAEAKERGWTVPGTALEWYENGIAAAMNEWGISDVAAISAYLAQPAVNYATASGDWKQKIGVQKWLGLFMQGTQGWAEWRRLDFQKLELPVDGAIGDVGTAIAPMRINYPNTEQSQNANGYATGLSALGGPDKLTTKLWWDKF